MTITRRQLAGLVDKLYWRRADGGFHCFTKARDGVLVSLCGRHELGRRTFGGSMARPPVMMRCGLCDSREAVRRGHDESMPESANWREYHFPGPVVLVGKEDA